MNIFGSMYPMVASIAEEPMLARLFFASLEMAVLAAMVWAVIRLVRIKSARITSVLWLLVLVKPLIALAIGAPLPLLRIVMPEPVAVPVTFIESEFLTEDPLPVFDFELVDTMEMEMAVAVEPSKPDRSFSWKWNVAETIVMAWFAGAITMVLYALFDKIRLHRLVKRTSNPPADVLAQYGELVKRIRVRRPPRLRVTELLESPALVGTVTPVILLPKWLIGEKGGQLEWSLRHELTHWKLGDSVADVARQLAKILFFFHPATWWAAGKWEEAAELACDRRLINSNSDAENYAGELYKMLAQIHGRRQRPVMGGLFATRTQIGRRIAALLSNPLKSPARLGFASCAFLAVTALAICVLGGTFVTSASEQETDVMEVLTETVVPDPVPEESPQSSELIQTQPIVAHNVELAFADPTARDGSYHSAWSVAFVLSFMDLAGVVEGLDRSIYTGMVTIGQTSHNLRIDESKPGLLIVSNRQTGQEIGAEPWPDDMKKLERTVTYPVKLGRTEYQCPVHVELRRREDASPIGSYWFCAYLSGSLPAGAGGKRFEIVNMDQQMEFRSTGERGKPDAVIGVDINGDGTIDPTKDGGESFDIYEPFNIDGRTLQVAEVDPYLPRVVFREVPAEERAASSADEQLSAAYYIEGLKRKVASIESLALDFSYTIERTERSTNDTEIHDTESTEFQYRSLPDKMFLKETYLEHDGFEKSYTEIVADGKEMQLDEKTIGYPDFVVKPAPRVLPDIALRYGFLLERRLLVGNELRADNPSLQMDRLKSAEGKDLVELRWRSSDGRGSHTARIDADQGNLVFVESVRSYDSRVHRKTYRFSEFQDAGAGIILPGTIRIEEDNTDASGTINMGVQSISASRITVNEPIPENVFDVEIVRGTTIYDMINGTDYPLKEDGKRASDFRDGTADGAMAQNPVKWTSDKNTGEKPYRRIVYKDVPLGDVAESFSPVIGKSVIVDLGDGVPEPGLNLEAHVLPTGAWLDLLKQMLTDRGYSVEISEGPEGSVDFKVGKDEDRWEGYGIRVRDMFVTHVVPMPGEDGLIDPATRLLLENRTVSATVTKHPEHNLITVTDIPDEQLLYLAKNDARFKKVNEGTTKVEPVVFWGTVIGYDGRSIVGARVTNWGGPQTDTTVESEKDGKLKMPLPEGRSGGEIVVFLDARHPDMPNHRGLLLKQLKREYHAQGHIMMIETCAVGGRVTDVYGNAIAMAKVTTHFRSGRIGKTDEEVYTDENGRYLFNNVVGGAQYRVEATADGYGQISSDEFIASPGKTYEVDDLELQTAKHAIEGRVFHEDGKPAQRAIVTVNAIGATPNRETRTDADGRFRLENLVDEDIEIVAFYTMDGADTLGHATARAGDTEVKVVLSPRHVSAD